jgi:chromatin remodeling complex protein RSC6
MYTYKMVRASKTSSSSDKQSATPAPVVAATPAPVVENVEKVATAKKATRKPKAETTPVVDAAPAPVVAATPAPVVDAPEVAAASSGAAPVSDSVVLMLNDFGAKLQVFAGQFSSLKTDFRHLERQVSRKIKSAEKLSSRKKKSSANRQPSGFVKPTRISDELAKFLGKEIGTHMARTVVSKEINDYIRTNGLQDKTNGRKINADNKLSSLLKLSKDDELTYFNLQKYMKHHFIKEEPVATA